MTQLRTVILGAGTLAAALTAGAVPTTPGQSAAPQITVYKGPT